MSARGLIGLVCVAALAAAGGGTARADTSNWRGAGTFGDTSTVPGSESTWWSEPGNWFGGVPGSGDTAYLAFTNAGYCNAASDTVSYLVVNGMSDEGALHLTDGTTLVAYYDAHVGDDDLGRVVHEGGTLKVEHSTAHCYLRLGQEVSANGTYELSGGTLSVRATTRSYQAATILGYWGRGEFVQSGGVHTIHSDYYAAHNYAYLYVGVEATSSGTYHLTDGTLHVRSDYASCGVEYIGYRGTGRFIQEGGTNRVTGSISIGTYADGNGRYELHGGTLEVQTVDSHVGQEGKGLFVQTGGVHGVGDDIFVGYKAGSTGTYLQTGGTVTVGDDLYLGYETGSRGLYRLDGGDLSVNSSELVGHSGQGTFIQTAGVHEVASGLGVYTQDAFEISGGTLNVGYDIAVGAQSSFTVTGGDVSVGRNLLINAAATWTQTGGSVTVADTLSGPYRLSGTGALETQAVKVGAAAGETFTHEAGAHDCFNLLVGDAAGTTGTYDLRGGTLAVGGEAVGDYGHGVVVQTGGDHTVYGILRLGRFAGGRGELDLAGGSLVAYNVSVGEYDGEGALTISDASATMEVRNDLTFGALGSFSAVPGAAIHMTGSALRNESSDEDALVGLAELAVVFEGGDDHWATLEVAAADMGLLPAGFEGNFVLGELVVGGDAPARLRLEDLFDNGNGPPEALYVHDLTVGPGSTLDLNGLHLYYDGRFVNEGHVVGEPIPEPLGLGLLALGGPIFLRRSKSRRR